jgi:hypothetical protein
VPLVKSVQELALQNKALINETTDQKKVINDLLARIEKIEQGKK